MNMTIDEMEMSVRTTLSLKRAGINTLEELLLLNDEDLLSIRNLGKWNILEIHEAIEQLTAVMDSSDELGDFVDLSDGGMT
jgi:DNA-directed RNA polymerase subunit alpha